MKKLNIKLVSILSVVLVFAIIVNSFILYRQISVLSNRQLKAEVEITAQELAFYLQDKITKEGIESVNEDMQSVIDLLDYQVAVISDNTKRVIYTNSPGTRIQAIINNERVIYSKAPIKGPKGETFANVIVLTKNSEITRLSTIFRTAIRNTLIMGIILVVLFMLLLYLLVTKPLKNIMNTMAQDKTIVMKETSDWYPIAAVHNEAYGRRLEQKKDQNLFFQNASHELKSPLMNIQGYMEALEDGIYEQEEASRLVIMETQRIKTLVDQMIRNSKAEHIEKGDIVPERIDMVAFVEDIKMMVPSELELLYEGNSDSFYFDRDLLQIIVSNLIQNACRYAKTTIGIKYVVEDYIALIVHDDGPGIDPMIVDKVFQRFVKGTDGLTGLGLSIVDQYVKATEGRIKAYNDNGAVFEINWPLK